MSDPPELEDELLEELELDEDDEFELLELEDELDDDELDELLDDDELDDEELLDDELDEELGVPEEPFPPQAAKAKVNALAPTSFIKRC